MVKMTSELREIDIKAALAEFLISRSMLCDDAVLINEMVVGDYQRRVDFAVANGCLHAYEIKSDADNLSRIEGQVGTYLEYFDKVTVVTGRKYALQVLSKTPPEVEVLAFELKDGVVGFKRIRRGKRSDVTHKSSLIELLTRAQLVRFLAMKGEQGVSKLNRRSAEERVYQYPINQLRGFVLGAVKNKYRASYESFLACRKTGKTIDAVAEMTRFARAESVKKDRVATTLVSCSDFEKRPNSIRLDLEGIRARYGDLPPNYPQYVIPRRC